MLLLLYAAALAAPSAVVIALHFAAPRRMEYWYCQMGLVQRSMPWHEYHAWIAKANGGNTPHDRPRSAQVGEEFPLLRAHCLEAERIDRTLDRWSWIANATERCLWLAIILFVCAGCMAMYGMFQSLEL